VVLSQNTRPSGTKDSCLPTSSGTRPPSQPFPRSLFALRFCPYYAHDSDKYFHILLIGRLVIAVIRADLCRAQPNKRKAIHACAMSQANPKVPNLDTRDLSGQSSRCFPLSRILLNLLQAAEVAPCLFMCPAVCDTPASSFTTITLLQCVCTRASQAAGHSPSQQSQQNPITPTIMPYRR
jgi:hypothetical protein